MGAGVLDTKDVELITAVTALACACACACAWTTNPAAEVTTAAVAKEPP